MTLLAERGHSESVPPLGNGDHLSLTEFERLWSLHPEIKKAELINGVVFLDMTVSQIHARAHAFVVAWLSQFWLLHSQTLELLVDGTLRLLDSQDLQPDVMLRKLRGGSTVTDGHVDGPPELVVEVSLSSWTRDMGNKREIYRAAGVPEYIVWQLHENRLEWFALEGDEYRPLAPNHDGILESRVFPGLQLSVESMLAFDASGIAPGSQGQRE